MKVFRVVGWAQYKTDCDTKIDSVQLAEDAKAAMENVASCYEDETKVVVSVVEIPVA